MTNPRASRSPSLAVLLILLGSYAFFWHARDWNSASRLMLTYAIVDHGTVAINGLEDQTRDRARIRNQYYSDKMPGFSLLGVLPYGASRALFGLPPHPVGRAGFAYWPADYWVTLATSGLATALCGALLTALACRMGCGPRTSALVGLSYGLATPAYVYATMSYGHQPAAFLLLASFSLVRGIADARRPALRAGLAGLAAAVAVTVELQVAPVAGVIGLMTLATRPSYREKSRAFLAFGLGAVGPAIVLLAYNTLAFGSPFDMGYFHEDLKVFSDVHSKQNPLGLRGPALDKVVPLLFSAYRGLFFYAPIVVLAVPGWVAWACRERVASGASLLICVLIFMVNLSYPEWTGGWSTGPRLLVPLLPFAMLAVAVLLARGNRGVLVIATILAVWGGVLILLFQGAGGQVPQFVGDPLREAVIPCWAGKPLPAWHSSGRFTRNVVAVVRPRWVGSLSPARQWLQLSPLIVAQVAAIGLLMFTRRSSDSRSLARESAEPRAKLVPE